MIYFDNSATTQLAPEVRDTMCRYMAEQYGNPSSPYRIGREARAALLEARARLARALRADAGDVDRRGEVLFTGSGTESDNLGILGPLRTLVRTGDRRRHLITSVIEHPAVLETFRHLQRTGWDVTFLPVDAEGNVRQEAYEKALRADTALVSIMMANNEVGTMQPIRAMAQRARENGSLFHTDAVQVLGKIPLDVHELGVDLLSVSAHKIYGPKGVGALYVREGLAIENLLHGGHQEYGLRPGTENMAGIVGFGAACVLLEKGMEEERERKERLARRLETGLLDALDDVHANGNPAYRIPGHLNLTFRHVEGESLLMALNLKGIACSSGSACSTGSTEPSHVLRAMGRGPLEAQSSIRFTIGRYNTQGDVDEAIRIIPALVSGLRSLSPLGRGEKKR